jgi:hypothetical protein
MGTRCTYFSLDLVYTCLFTVTIDSRYNDICYNEIMLITIPNLYPNHSQTIEIQTGYIDSLVILIHFPYPISIVIMRVYCSTLSYFKRLLSSSLQKNKSIGGFRCACFSSESPSTSAKKNLSGYTVQWV